MNRSYIHIHTYIQAVLAAPTAGAALAIVTEGIRTSIKHLDGSAPLW
jgi:hypothetical protein